MANKKEMIEETAGTLITPNQYFDLLKGKRNVAEREELQYLLDNAIKMMKRYLVTGQTSGAKKLYNFIKLCERELQVVDMGYNTYVTREILDHYINKVSKKAVCILELEEYERDLPDHVIDKLIPLKASNVFDAYFVVFTDYTGKVRKKIAKEEREKDPILFGALMIGNQISTRLYYIDSWVDEFCDLTLDKLIAELKSDKNYGKDFAVTGKINEQFENEQALMTAYDQYSKRLIHTEPDTLTQLEESISAKYNVVVESDSVEEVD